MSQENATIDLNAPCHSIGSTKSNDSAKASQGSNYAEPIIKMKEQCGQAYERLRQNILSTFGLLDQIAMVAEIAQPMGGHSLLPQAPKYCILVDTSDKDWGGAFQHRVVQGLWTADGRFQSINWRELKVIELILLAFPLLHDILF
ncbi:hypothetical protein NQZ79_g3425 [Umbelopsis isabellina]|nr:hypothetical protein NQZ79_g3425 [Umbelopsis isabellina]